jgi:hypothetical protein
MTIPETSATRDELMMLARIVCMLYNLHCMPLVGLMELPANFAHHYFVG